MHQGAVENNILPVRMIAWEITRRCPYSCKHCRAGAVDVPYDGELSTDECKALIDSIARHTRATLLFTGGEPMSRSDIYHLASYAKNKGIRVVMAPCGSLIDDESAGKIKEAGILRLSLSLDGLDAATHDDFRGVPGAYTSLMNAVEILKRHEIPFQINCTVSKHNLHQIESIYARAIEIGAVAFHPFFLVPVGRGRSLSHLELSRNECERTIRFFCREMIRSDFEIRITCAPQFVRIMDKLLENEDSPKKERLLQQRGCLAGDSFIFISHSGKIQPCGFCDIQCASLRDYAFDLRDVLDSSEVIKNLRSKKYHGICGACGYLATCGGCRARAFEQSGDYMAGDAYCIYSGEDLV